MKEQQRQKAQKLREQGESIGVIAGLLGVSKGSVSRWCKNITLSSTQRKRLTDRQRKASIVALRHFTKRKMEQTALRIGKVHEIGKTKVGTLSKRDVFITGLALYWGEGSKKGPGEVEFTNEEPASIIFMMHWFHEIYGIQLKDFILRVTINIIHKQRIGAVLAFWSHLTDVPTGQFTKVSFIKTKQNRLYKNLLSHFGTLRIKIRRSTELRRQILGSLEALGRKTSP